MTKNQKAQIASSFLVGFIFALGLGLSGMTQTSKIVGFLDIFSGQWDPTLMFVMLGAIPVHFISHRLLAGRHSPLFDSKFHTPSRKDLTPHLIVGSAIFGIGWAIGGYCPGPGIASVGSLAIEPIIFVVSLTSGMFLFRIYQNILGR